MMRYFSFRYIGTISTSFKHSVFYLHDLRITVQMPQNTNLNTLRHSSSFPSHSQIIIAGAGIVANSVAYHLVHRGWKDVLVLEQNSIGSGTSHFGSGTLGLLKSIPHRNLVEYSIKLYRELQSMGYDIEMRSCGSINLAQTKDRMIAMRRTMASNIPTGLHCEILGQKELKRLHPYLHTHDIEGALWVPEDAVVNPSKVCKVLSQLAKEKGATYIEHCQIERVFTKNGTVEKVQTERGTVFCEYFVNCAGMWARELGLRCDPPVRIPAYPAEHLYAITTHFTPALNMNLPCIRDFDSYSYMRGWEGKLLVGWFEPEAKPAFENNKVPRKNWTRYLESDRKHWKPLWDKVIHRLPILNGTKDPKVHNCPDNFTPDGKWILGESPEVKKYFVAVGMNGNSLQGAGGIGKEIAECLINGTSTQELLPFNVQRFLDLHNNKQYLQQRTKEIVGQNYAISYPHQCEYKYARNLRCSPLYSVLEERGAVFGIKMAYERALYFDSTYQRGHKKPIMPPGTFFKPKFFEFMKEEFQACREGVGIIDMSSFSKIQIKSSGNEVVSYLQRLCSNNVNVPVGGIVHTGMQNEKGGYENDCMLVRQTENKYFMVSPTLQQTRIHQWMSKHLPSDHSVGLNDVTSKYTVLNVVGAKATSLLSELSNSDTNLPAFTYKLMNIAYASDVMVMAFTHTGEPGYCLYIPSEYAIHVYLKLMEIGKDFGIRDVGVLTQRFMRIERFIPFWAEELTPFVTPYEAGIGYCVKLNKDFIGQSALQRQKEIGVKKRLVLFVLDDLDINQDIWVWGGESIYYNGEFVGTITSAGYGFTVEKLIALGFISMPKSKWDEQGQMVTNDFITDTRGRYEIDIAGRKFRAKPHIHPLPIPVSSCEINKKYIPTPVISYQNEANY